jgi:hypothetical protein
MILSSSGMLSTLSPTNSSSDAIERFEGAILNLGKSTGGVGEEGGFEKEARTILKKLEDRTRLKRPFETLVE